MSGYEDEALGRALIVSAYWAALGFCCGGLIAALWRRWRDWDR